MGLLIGLVIFSFVEPAATVDGNWGAWTNYSVCSHTCGSGSQTRWRYCNNPRPSSDGIYCQGGHVETRPCHVTTCPTDGAWGQWTSYQACSVTCGTGTKSRYRYCNSPHPAHGGLTCKGDGVETQSCSPNSCPGQTGVVNGGWGSWSQLSDCTQSCGGGTQTSYRWCNNPRPAGGGHDCPGSDALTKTCNTQQCPCQGSACPVNGGWGKWTTFGTCSRTCGTGTQTRYRYCNSPHPAHGGKACVGENFETQNCQLMTCSGSVVNGGWSLWSAYGTCSKTCGSGTKSRHRVCDNPKPSPTGSPCPGVAQETTSCHTGSCTCSGTNCPVNGGWGNWLQFSSCSHACGGGTKTRWRYCNNPSPSHGGQLCQGSQKDTQSCNTGSCGASDACGMVVATNTSKRIMGGKQAYHGQFPWQVSIRYFKQHICGGTLISDQWVLTAAHCFEDMGQPNGWYVGVGLQDVNQTVPSNIVHVSHIYVNPRHEVKLERHDIALLKLSKRIDITGKYARTACLPQPMDIFSSDTCIVSGWGTLYYDDNDKSPSPSSLQYVELHTMTNYRCTQLIGYNTIINTNLCAGGLQDGVDTCQGDSGGPLACKKHGVWMVAGVTSWGNGCGLHLSPGVYTRVTSYLTWIQETMKNG